MFTPVLKLEIAVICLVHMVAIVLSVVCLTLFYMKTRRDDPAANAFLVMQGAMIFWMIFKIFKTVAPEIHSRWVFILGYYACTCILEMAFIEFGYAYDKGRALPSKARRILYWFPVVQFSWILTNPLHHLFYPRYDFWDDTFGPLFYIHMALEYSFIIAGFVYCRRRFKREFSGRNKIVTYIVSIAIITPLVLNFLYISKVINHLTLIAQIPVVFDITPIVFTWSTLLFIYATFNHDFLSPTPLMRHEITHHLNLALALLKKDFSPGYSNQAFQALANGTDRGHPGENAPEMEMDSPAAKGGDNGSAATMGQLLDRLRANAAGATSLGYEESLGDKRLFVHCRTLEQMGRTQYLVTLKDISTFTAIQADIREKSRAVGRENQALEKTIDRLKQLSRQSARTFVARELHDIIGHSLVAALKLMEVAQIYHETAPDQSRSALEKANQALDTGLSGIKTIPISGAPGAPAGKTGEELKQRLEAMAAPLREVGLAVTLNVQGIIYVLDPDTFHTLERTCTELTTNCLKHANANSLFLSLKIRETGIRLLAVDDGVGMAGRSGRGSGLSGMEERITALGGTIVFSPAENDGFMVRIHIPQA